MEAPAATPRGALIPAALLPGLPAIALALWQALRLAAAGSAPHERRVTLLAVAAPPIYTVLGHRAHAARGRADRHPHRRIRALSMSATS